MSVSKQKKMCNHEQTIDQMMPEGCIHYSKKICVLCNSFIKWNQNPNTIAKKEAMNKIIEKIILLDLTKFEKSFVSSIHSLNHLSPKQEEIWIKICDKYKII